MGGPIRGARTSVWSCRSPSSIVGRNLSPSPGAGRAIFHCLTDVLCRARRQNTSAAAGHSLTGCSTSAAQLQWRPYVTPARSGAPVATILAVWDELQSVSAADKYTLAKIARVSLRWRPIMGGICGVMPRHREGNVEAFYATLSSCEPMTQRKSRASQLPSVRRAAVPV